MSESKPPRGPRAPVEIRWDDQGVPHIFAADDDDASYGLGWSQAKAHAGLVLELYGVARGRAAEYWGEQFRDSDVLAATMGLPEVGSKCWDAQPAGPRRRVESFCDGFNAWCLAHEEAGATRRAALPVTPLDVFAHYARNLFHYAQRNSDMQTQAFPAEPFPVPGSNAWAVSGSRSETGAALLLGGPHVPWSGRYVFFEHHSVSPGRDFYGVCSVGLPWGNIGFNDAVGWAHTVNPIDLFDVYRLTAAGDGYLFDGGEQAFEERSHELAVRADDGTLTTETITLRRSVHGPVVTAGDGTTAAVRVAGLTVEPAVTGLEGWWAMSLARDIDGLREALSSHRLPMFTVVAADSGGRVAGIYCGRPPVRPHGSFGDWSGWLPGDSSHWLWSATHPQESLPELCDPPSGVVQSTNDPPWTFTWPPALDPAAYPASVAPPARFPGFRTLAATEPFLADRPVRLDDLVHLNFSTRVRVADHVLDDLIAAAKESPRGVIEAAGVLEAWDRNASATSRGALLFLTWLGEMAPEIAAARMFARKWSADDPFRTPASLGHPEVAVAALARAVRQLSEAGQQLDAAIGEVWRMRAGQCELPADGGPSAAGVLKALSVAPDADGARTAVFGYTFVAAVEFSTPVRAQGLLVYENATEPGPAVSAPQLHLAAENCLRSIHLTRPEICQATRHVDTLSPGSES